MAGVSTLPAEVLLSKRVQDMVIGVEEPPAPYICRDDPITKEEFSPVSQIPIIDLSFFSSSTSTTKEKEEALRKLKSALCTWGCFQLLIMNVKAIGHGISTPLFNKLLQITREFFQLPREEKKKSAKTVLEFEGYGADPVPEEGQSLDWSDRLLLEVYPEHRRNFKLWPEKPNSFRDVLEEYTEKMRMVTELTSKSLAKSLHLEENSFLKQFGNGALLQARFNLYSRCHRPDLVLGLKPHSDGTGYTIIFQDESGIQIQKDDKWYTVPRISNSLIILMGDQMEIMSNGIFKSAVHRVVTNSERERISVVMFYTPEPGKEIGPEEGLVDEDNPRLFKKVKDYADTHWGYYQKGERALHTAKP